LVNIKINKKVKIVFKLLFRISQNDVNKTQQMVLYLRDMWLLSGR